MYKTNYFTLLTLLIILKKKKSFIEFSCPGNNSKPIQGILLKIHNVIKDIKRKCSVQES